MAGADPASELTPQSISSPATRDDDDDEDPARARRDGLIDDGLIDDGVIDDGVVDDGVDAPPTSRARVPRRRRAGDEATDHSPPSEVSTPESRFPESTGTSRKRPAGPTSRHSTKNSRRRPSSPTLGAHSRRISEDVVRVATHSPGRAGGVRSNGTISDPSSDPSSEPFRVFWVFWFFWDFPLAGGGAGAGAGSVEPTKTSEGADVPTRFLALTVTAYAVAGSNPVSVETHPSHTGTSSVVSGTASPTRVFGRHRMTYRVSLHPPLCSGGCHDTVIVVDVARTSAGARGGASGGPSSVLTASDGDVYSEKSVLASVSSRARRRARTRKRW